MKIPPEKITKILVELGRRYLYDPETGKFTWAINCEPMKIGDRAGKWKQGEFVLTCLGYELPGRRVAWWFLHGEYPVFKIAVRDGNPENLGASNLVPMKDLNLARRTRACAECGTEFILSRSGATAKFCSLGCRQKHHHKGGEAGVATCRGCGKTLPIDEFKIYSTGRAPYCTACANRNSYARELKRKFGIGLPEVSAMLAEQGNACAICHTSFDIAKPAVDHNHATNAVRGILCTQCNLGLGYFKDDADLLVAAANYLDKPNFSELAA